MREERQAARKMSKHTVSIRKRIWFLTVLFGVAMFVPLVMKLYDISIEQHEELERKAIAQQTKSFTIAAGRGAIFDRNGNALALSADVQTVCVAPNQMQNLTDAEKDKIAGDLSALLGVDKDFILDRMSRVHRANEIIKRNLEKEDAKIILEYITENKLSRQIFLEPASKRYYPGGSLASGVVGFVGSDNNGLLGIEAGYDEKLTGIPGYTISARDRRGNPMPNQFEMYYDAQEGHNLVLALDSTIQHFVEKHLETAIIENRVAERACVIVMDVKTGGVLAMSTMGDFDLNDPFTIADQDIWDDLQEFEGTEEYNGLLSDARQAQWRNKAINDTYEPGSTFKVFTAAMALEERAVDLGSDSYNCTGVMQVGKWDIHCHKRQGHGTQTFARALENSCNPAFINIGGRVGPHKFFDYMHAFGFMDRTGIDLQGESRSIVSPFAAYNRDAAAQAVYSFGQTFKVTPIQMITAMSAVANGGYLMKPHVVSQVVDRDGHIVHANEPTVVRQVISQETSQRMRGLLQGCVESGTGRNAYVKGYNVAGKTGTSQKRDVEGAEDAGWYVVSFLGFAPAEDPEIAILVMLDTPGRERQIRTGGFMAAPVAGRIFADALPYLGVMRQLSPDDILNMEVKVPFVRNKSVEDAKKDAERVGLSVRIEGEGDTVLDQLPLAGSEVPPTTELILYTETERPGMAVTVPAIIGESPEEANRLLTNAGLLMRPTGALSTGTGILRAAWQEFSEGQEIPYGQVIRVEFRNQDVADN